MLLLGPLLTVFVAALAAAFGGRAEREAAGLGIFVLALWLVMGAAFGLRSELALALSDLLLAAGFLALALRHRRLWLCAETALALVLVVAHVLRDDLAGDRGAAMLVDGADVALLLVLLGATAAGRTPAARRAQA